MTTPVLQEIEYYEEVTKTFFYYLLSLLGDHDLTSKQYLLEFVWADE